ncbi:MAG: ATP-binding protein [Deltaproteobacteria bacterium]|nr:ATP-binding protein [Deltaproteobacteria bacterium]
MVLLFRGARQVGKTYSIRKLGSAFETFLEINFEKDPRLASFFEGSLNPTEINQKLTAYSGVSLVPGKSLLFFDEIQACPNAIRALRFYHEEMPDLHVVAAGSMLEFALAEIPSFGVGRITNLFLYPLSFREFLWATGRKELDQMVQDANPQTSLDSVLHRELLEQFRLYQVLGGMPAVIRAFIKGSELPACQKIIDGLVLTLQDDFAKYKKRGSVTRLMEVFRAAAQQAGGKFQYSKVAQGEAMHGYKVALELLCMAGFAYRITHTSAGGIPLGAQINPKKFKVILFDLGIHQRLLGLDLSEHIVKEPIDLISKGNLAELFVGLELLAYHEPSVRPQLFYWHREARASNAEVDYVIQRDEAILPIEVKAGTKGGMRSLFAFLEEKGLSLGIRFSHENFSRMERVAVMPIYAVSKLFSATHFLI